MRNFACAKYPTKVCDLLRKTLSLRKVGATVQLSVTTDPLSESGTMKITYPARGGLLNQGFTYVPAVRTDIRATFERIRREQQQPRLLPAPAVKGGV